MPVSDGRPLLTTDQAVVWIMAHGCDLTDPAKVARKLYNLARDGKITRHGAPGRWNARWDVRELQVIIDGH